MCDAMNIERLIVILVISFMLACASGHALVSPQMALAPGKIRVYLEGVPGVCIIATEILVMPMIDADKRQAPKPSFAASDTCLDFPRYAIYHLHECGPHAVVVAYHSDDGRRIVKTGRHDACQPR
jgi:hypothetical protein